METNVHLKHSDICKAVREFIADDDPEIAQAIDEETNLFEIKAFDSLKIVNLVLFVEERFDLALFYEDLTEENLTSLKSITDLICRKQTDLQGSEQRAGT